VERVEALSGKRAEADAIAKEFILPGARPWRFSSAAPEMMQVEALVAQGTGVSTWRKLRAPWRRAKAYIQSRMELDLRVFGVEALSTHQWYVTAAAVHAYNTSSAIGAVSSCLQACHKAMRMSHIVVVAQEYDKALTKVAQLKRSTALKKVAAISWKEVCAVVKGVGNTAERKEGWGGRHMPLVLRQIALQMELSFHKLLRFSCMALVNLHFIYWMDKSFAFKLVKRKNDQSGKLPWLVIGWTSTDCLAQRFKDFVIDTNPLLHIPKWGFTRSNAFVFRLIGPPAHKSTGHSHFQKCRKLGCAYVITGDGQLPISCEPRARRSGYRRMVELMRLAMRHFCGYTPTQIEIFASQSCRRGGDTHLWKNGVSKEVRNAMGCWKTPEVELEYLEMELEDQLKFDKKLYSKVV
jgi:hypothetical protein